MNRMKFAATPDQLVKERQNDINTVEDLQLGKLPGRFVTKTRIAGVPISNSDVQRGDSEGDIITDATYIYTLVMVSGVPKWDRRSLSVAW